MDKDKPKHYRKGVGVMLINSDGKVFVAQRIDTDIPAWQMPQGGIDKKEDPAETALRELEEETGIDTELVEILAETEDWIRYDLPTDLQGKLWKGKYRGQEQKWFLARFLGEDDDIDLDNEDPEFCDWRWEDIDRLPELIVDFKRPLYEQVLATFRDKVKALEDL